jgi:myosin heavy subunit
MFRAMNAFNWITRILLVAAVAAAVVGWRKAEQLRSDNESLRTELQGAKEQTAAIAEAERKKIQSELEQLRGEAQDILKLRSESARLKESAREAEKLRSENQRLRTDIQRLASAPSPAAPAPPPPPADQFPRDTWTFAGYSTPESALISAVWAMREGKPQTYLESLAPDEQARMAKQWLNKSEAELAAKHQQDTAAISGLRILDRNAISPDEIQMNVFIDGVNRAEKVSLKRVGNEWKFGGFIRAPQK